MKFEYGFHEEDSNETYWMMYRANSILKIILFFFNLFTILCFLGMIRFFVKNLFENATKIKIQVVITIFVIFLVNLKDNLFFLAYVNFHELKTGKIKEDNIKVDKISIVIQFFNIIMPFLVTYGITTVIHHFAKGQ